MIWSAAFRNSLEGMPGSLPGPYGAQGERGALLSTKSHGHPGGCAWKPAVMVRRCGLSISGSQPERAGPSFVTELVMVMHIMLCLVQARAWGHGDVEDGFFDNHYTSCVNGLDRRNVVY